MQKSLFKIQKMDCPSEEQLIRIKMEEFSQIKQLNFDIPNRQLTVFHDGKIDTVENALHSLKLDSELISTEEIDIELEPVIDAGRLEKKLLIWVLVINAVFFVVELITGWLSGSMGLVADSFDMLADAIVYSLSLFAVGGAITRKKRIAKMSGYFQLALAVFGFIEVLRRFFGFEDVPEFRMMIIVSVFALLGNAACLFLLQRSRSKEVHMQASMIFTSNDVIANIGVIAAGALVFFLNSKIPDLIVGAIVFGLVARGAYRILSLSK